MTTSRDAALDRALLGRHTSAMTRPLLLFTRVLALGCLLPLGCATVQVKTDPPDARVEVDGTDVSRERSFKEGLGWKDHAITVRREGYQAKTVMVPRDRVNLSWVIPSFLGSVGCTFLSAGCACCAGGLLGNRQVVPDILGAALASLAGGAACLLLFPINVLTAAVVGNVAPDICMVPAMGICTLLGSWPLAGLALPLVSPRAADVVEVKLEPLPGAHPEDDERDEGTGSSAEPRVTDARF